MAAPEFERLKALFLDALARQGDARREWLDSACEGDEVLRTKVERMLAWHEAEEEAGVEDVPDRIGPYVLGEMIGCGGMGVVHLAEQTSPVRRTVAIKLLRAGMDSLQVIGRFESERQALAMMDHANVAKIFDAGTTPNGRHYVVMEYVPGTPITQFCDARRSTIDERLALFTDVCRAVQHSHQKGVVHRDIKASNVLVMAQDGIAIPKVIDFGIAKMLDSSAADRAFATVTGQFIGTLESMSPEQVSSRTSDVDTRTDVYSLGVLLYELLVGVPPFDPKRLRGTSLVEAQRILCEEVPQRPSLRVPIGETSGVAATRRLHARTLRRRLRGDLDWIVMKTLEKDPDRRYASASDLLADLERHMRHEPVSAGPPSGVYRIVRFARRHRVVAAAAMCVLSTLVIALIVSIGFALRERDQRELTTAALNKSRANEIVANEARARLETVVEYQTAMLESIDAWKFGRMIMTQLRESFGVPAESLETVDATELARVVLEGGVLAQAASAMGGGLDDEPFVEARLRQTLGGAYFAIGLHEQALIHLDAALAIYRRDAGDDDPRTIGVMTGRGSALDAAGRHEEAESQNREALERARRVFGDEARATLSAMGDLSASLVGLERYEEALEYLEPCLDARRSDEPEALDTLTAIHNMGVILESLGRTDEAMAYYREAVETATRVRGPEDPHTLRCLAGVASLEFSEGEVEESLAKWMRVYEGLRSALGEGHPNTVRAIDGVGSALVAVGRNAEALDWLDRAVEASVEALGDDHPATINARMNRAVCLANLGRTAEALEMHRSVLAWRRDRLGEEHIDTLRGRMELARLLGATGQTDASLEESLAAASAMEDALGAEHPTSLDAFGEVVFQLLGQARAAEAVPWARKMMAGCEATVGADAEETLRAIYLLVRSLSEAKRVEEAEAVSRDLVARVRRLSSGKGLRFAACSSEHGRLLFALSRFDEAESCFLEAYEAIASEIGADSAEARAVARALTQFYETTSRAGDTSGTDEDPRIATWRERAEGK